eukprot:6591288-Prymnesium_polylepis.1
MGLRWVVHASAYCSKYLRSPQRAHPDRCSVCEDFDGPTLARGIQRRCDLEAASRRVQDRARVDGA